MPRSRTATGTQVEPVSVQQRLRQVKNYLKKKNRKDHEAFLGMYLPVFLIVRRVRLDTTWSM